MTVVDARGNRNGTPGANSVGWVEEQGSRAAAARASAARSGTGPHGRTGIETSEAMSPDGGATTLGPCTPSTANRTVCERGQPAPVTWTDRGSSARSTVPGSAAIVQRPTVRVAVSTQPVSMMASCRRRTIGPVAAGSVTASATKEPVALVTPEAICWPDPSTRTRNWWLALRLPPRRSPVVGVPSVQTGCASRYGREVAPDAGVANVDAAAADASAPAASTATSRLTASAGRSPGRSGPGCTPRPWPCRAGSGWCSRW